MAQLDIKPAEPIETPNLRFAHLHVHSEYSITDGAIRIGSLIKKAKAEGHSAVALTDFTNMFGAVEFYSKAKEMGLKPILGAELLIAFPEPVAALFPPIKSQDNETSVVACTKAFNIILLAKNLAGYKNLIKTVSLGFLDPASSQFPIVSWENLVSHASDLIAIDCMFNGLVSQLILAPELTANRDAVIKTATDLLSSAFKNSYYLQLTENALPTQAQLMTKVSEVGTRNDVPVVAAPLALYLNEEDHEAHTVLTCVKNDLTLSDIRQRRQNARFHLLSNSEFASTFAAFPEATANIAKIVDECNVSLEFGKYYLPNFTTETDANIDDALRRLSREGLEERLRVLRPLYGEEFGAEQEKQYQDRLEFELDVIIKMGFPGYFLIVQDFINWAKRQGIPVGPGRGSGAGSLVAYSLRITDLDPIPYNLIFERFLNPERVSMPDFDVDFCQDRRDEVIRYVTEHYGKQNVAQITTFGKMKAKAALRDVGRVLEVSYGKVDRIAKLIPNELEITLKDAMQKEPRIMEEAAKDPNISDMINIALQLEGLCRHTSVHAAGVVISEGGMDNYVPVYKDPAGSLITQYEMKNAEKVGLVKFDFLGLKTLTVIDRTIKLLNEAGHKNFKIDTIDLELPPVYDQLSLAHTTGIFQLEGGGMQSLLLKLKPSRFEDIVAVVALFRPGPLGSGMVDDFIERKHGRQEITYPVPQLEDILKDTYGIILYQEQVQKIAAILASYSLGEADLLRRAMGKKKPEEMAKQKSRFIEGAKKNQIDEKIADDIFELMAKFAAYGFNKSHSAAYGLVSYQTAYLKTFYPEYFMAAIMSCDLDNSEKLTRYIHECRRLGFAVLPININSSSLYFAVPKAKQVSFALAAIKGIGIGSLEPILQEREANGPFTSLTDFAKRVRLHRVGKKTIELLILAGALDCFNLSREYMLRIVGEVVRYSEAGYSAKSAGARLLFDEDDNNEGAAGSLAEWDSERLARRTIDTLDTLLKEKKLLGAFLAKHPLSFFKDDQNKFGSVRVADIPTRLGQKNVAFVALLNGTSERLSKTGRRMMYLDLEDETGQIECLMFPNDDTPPLPSAPALVQVVVSVQKSFDGNALNIRVEKVTSLVDLRRKLIHSASVELKLPTPKDQAELSDQHQTLQAIHDLVQKHPGQTKLQVVLNYGKAKVKVKSAQLGVDLCEPLLQTFYQMGGEGLSIRYLQNYASTEDMPYDS